MRRLMKRTLAVLATIAGMALIIYGFYGVIKIREDVVMAFFSAMAFVFGGVFFLALGRYFSTGKWDQEDAAGKILSESKQR